MNCNRVFTPLLAAALAGTAAAQTDLPTLQLDLHPAQVGVSIAQQGTFLGALVLGFTPDTFQLPGGQHILANPVVAWYAAGDNVIANRFLVAPAVLADLDLYVQAVTLTGNAVGATEPVRMRQYLLDNPLLPDLAVNLAWAESQPPRLQLMADYEGRSDGYGLAVVAVEPTETGTDVYLWWRTPGPGEGMLDIVEHHLAFADLGTVPGKQVRLFAGEAVGGLPVTGYGLIRTLPVPR